MAKIKVHELAKELDKQSKDIIAFLQEKGIEAKAAQSSVEEEAAQLVRKQFGGAGKTESPMKEESKQATKVEAPVEKEEVKVEAAKAENEDAPKKKKKIIFVSNPQNSPSS